MQAEAVQNAVGCLFVNLYGACGLFLFVHLLEVFQAMTEDICHGRHGARPGGRMVLASSDGDRVRRGCREGGSLCAWLGQGQEGFRTRGLRLLLHGIGVRLCIENGTSGDLLALGTSADGGRDGVGLSGAVARLLLLLNAGDNLICNVRNPRGKNEIADGITASEIVQSDAIDSNCRGNRGCGGAAL